MAAKLGLWGRKMSYHYQEQRWKWLDRCVVWNCLIRLHVLDWEKGWMWRILWLCCSVIGYLNWVSTSLGNSGLRWTVFARNRDTVVPTEGNGDLQTMICVLVAKPRQCPTLSNAVPWQNWMVAYLGYTLRLTSLLLVCVSFTIIGQPRNSVLIRRV